MYVYLCMYVCTHGLASNGLSGVRVFASNLMYPLHCLVRSEICPTILDS